MANGADLDKVSMEELVALERSQRQHIEKLRRMLWIAAGTEDVEDSPLRTEAEFQKVLAMFTERQLQGIKPDVECDGSSL